MISSLSFTNPLLLAALAGLPVLWWLLRIMPPRPNHVTFPPIAFLLNLRDTEETPHHTPLWLLVLRLVLAALIIVGLAGPILNPPPKLTGDGPLVLVIDDGWGSAATWARRLDILGQTIDQANRDGRPLALITTAVGPGQHLGSTLLSAQDARSELEKLAPRAWPTSRQITAQKLGVAWPSALAGTKPDFIWLPDGLADDVPGGSTELADVLNHHGRVLVLETQALRSPLALTPPSRSGNALEVKVLRPDSQDDRSGQIRAIDNQSRTLATSDFTFGDSTQETSASFELPLELQNTIARIEIAGERSAGAVSLVDERWQRRTVAIATAGTGDIDKPLLSDIFYLDRALAPFAEVRRGDIESLFVRPPSVLILPDFGQIPKAQGDAIEKWVRAGGLLVRFAGPRLALHHDPLVPVPLRQGGRALGGALSWEEPQHLAPFDDKSPFFGLTIPADVTISKQVLAEPSIDLASHTWARLSDGTPLVTADRRGEGWTVLFHVTANPDWSTLPMSGLFVEMLERAISYSRAEAATLPDHADTGDTYLYIEKVINGFGELEAAKGTFDPIAFENLANWIPGAATPPGIYQRPAMVRALNLTNRSTRLAPLPALPSHVEVMTLGSELAVDLRPPAITLALLLALLDGILMLLMGRTGELSRLLSGKTALKNSITGAFALVLVFNLTQPSDASDASEKEALRATLKTHLAFVITDVRETDRLSERGLIGLSNVIGARTAVEPGDPIGINLETDELAFFPLIYWPISADHKMFSVAAMDRLNRYMRTGGTVIFDTQDQQVQFTGLSGTGAETANARRLREILTSLDIPPLTTIPDDHVLTKSFYLLREFPGRWQGGKVWVEAISSDGDTNAGGSLNDGVSSVIIGANDWAAAWAVDDFGRPLAVTVPGGMRQRELAYRFGVNIVMYTLTGNYKADQVHVPALLERLGQ